MGITPVLDAMAKRGMLLRNAFTCQPVCGPARASLQTGLYAAATGCFRNSIPLPPGSPTIARYLGAVGYDTGYIGKWHLGGGRGPVAAEYRGGYGFWRGSEVLEHTSHPYDGCLFDENNRSVRLRGYRVDAMTDIVLDFIRRGRDDKPFFLMASYLEPHFQNDMNHFVAPDGYAERYRDCYIPPDLAASGAGDWREELPGYYGCCKSLDENLGRVLEELDRCGKRDNTVVVFISDHGCHFRTRNAEYKRSCHESSIRIPLVIDGPGFTGAGERAELASLVDVPTTLLAAAGAPMPPHVHGRDLHDLTSASARAAWQNEVFVQISESHTGRAIRTDRWKYSVRAARPTSPEPPATDVYIEDFLYDLQADPHELTNLIGDARHAATAEHLRRRLLERIRAADERAPVIMSAARA
jgi:arylsulfatase A-like enzyme